MDLIQVKKWKKLENKKINLKKRRNTNNEEMEKTEYAERNASIL